MENVSAYQADGEAPGSLSVYRKQEDGTVDS